MLQSKKATHNVHNNWNAGGGSGGRRAAHRRHHPTRQIQLHYCPCNLRCAWYRLQQAVVYLCLANPCCIVASTTDYQVQSSRFLPKMKNQHADTAGCAGYRWVERAVPHTHAQFFHVVKQRHQPQDTQTNCHHAQYVSAWVRSVRHGLPWDRLPYIPCI